MEVSIYSNRPPDERDYSSDHGGGPLSTWIRPRLTSGLLDAGNEVALQFAGAGRYQLGLSVVNTVIRKTQAVAGFEPAEIELAAGGGQVVELRVPQEGLREALERVR